ncbi:MAG TPA: RHS repeat-associated core domain-containing protein [Kiritimatiellia bacterium]|nr:RHS repeat-associated core domain-containing protein [Kiritimatiellia bacterium]
MLVLLVPAIAPGMTSTGGLITVQWSIAEIPDAQIQLVSRSDTPEITQITYAAPLKPDMSYGVSMSVANTQLLSNSIPLERQGRIDIPYTHCLWRSHLVWHAEGSPPAVLNLTHRDPFVPNRTYSQIEILSATLDSQTNYWPDIRDMKFVYIYIIPKDALAIGYWEWLMGLPEYTGFEPPVKFHKPEGCGGCVPMGLPGFRINTCTLNLLVEDTDYAYSSPGPDLTFTRTWNANPAATGMFGRGWTFSAESHLSGSYLTVSRYGGSGQAMYYGVPPGSIDTNQAGGEIPVYYVTNTSARSSDSVTPLVTWDGDYVVPPGETRRFRRTNDTARGVWVYEWFDPRTGDTWYYESADVRDAWIPLVRIEDGNSNRVTLGYNGTRLTNITDAVGRSTRFQYDAQGRCTNVIVPGGAACAYRYDANQNLVESRDAAGNTTLFRYNAQHYMTNMSTEGRTWTFTWETGSVAGTYTRISTVADALGRTNYYYAMSQPMDNRAVWRDDPTGGFWIYYSSNGMTTQVKDPTDRYTLTSYSNGWATTVTNPGGCTMRMSYDPHGRLLRRVNYDGTVETRGYDAKGRIAAATNALGQAMRFGYDSRGNLTNLVSFGGREQRWQYNALGLVTAAVNAAGERTTFAFNSLGKPTRMTDPLGYSATFGYDAAGFDVVAITNRRGFVTRFEYDALRRRTRTIRPDGTTERIVYDCCAESQRIDGNSRTTTVERNAMLWPTASIDPMGRRTTYAYNNFNKLKRIVDPLARTNTYRYDAAGRMTNHITALGRSMYYTYDANDNISSVSTSAFSSDFYSFSFDCMNRVQSINDPLWHFTSCYYDPLGRLTNTFNARFQRTGFTYDADGLLIGRVENGAASVFAYDAALRLTNFSNDAGSFSYTYDARGDVIAARYPGGRTLSFARDPEGNVTTMTYPDGTVVSYACDSRDRVTNMAWGANWIRFTYDAEGNPLREQRSNGGDTYWGWDAANDPTGILHRAGTSNLIQLAYYRDAAGQTTNIVKQGGLIPWSPLQSPATNRARFDVANEATQRNTSACTYDADGNQTAGTNFTAAYDTANRLTSITRGGTNSAWTYDALGRRASVTTGGSARRLYYDHADRLICEDDGASRVTALYFYRGRALVAAWFAGRGTHFYHADKNGSTIAMTDEQGKLSALYRYDAYGQPAGGYSRMNNPFTFIGRYGVTDEGGGLYFMKARCYDATAGRFLQRDPLGLLPDVNVYRYVRGNPVDRIDPEGTEDDNTFDLEGSVEMATSISDDILQGSELSGFGKGLAEAGIIGPVEASELEALAAKLLEQYERSAWENGERQRALEAQWRCVVSETPMTPEEQAVWNSMPSSF